MSDHLVLYVDRLLTPQTVQTPQPDITSEDASVIPAKQKDELSNANNNVKIDDDCDEEQPLIQMVECRICQEEDNIKNLETPCACSGSLKYAHRACVQRWCNEKGDTTCEICHQNIPVLSRNELKIFNRDHSNTVSIDLEDSKDKFLAANPAINHGYKPGYIAPPPRPSPDETTIDISDGWTITGSQMDLHDPRVLAMAAAQRRFLEAEYDEYAATNASGAAFCRSAALILMALLLMRHALTLSNGDDNDDDASAYFSLFLLRAAGFLLPCYIMAWAISILQSRRQRQEAAAVAAAEVAFILQSGQARGLQFTIASPTTPQQESHQ